MKKTKKILALTLALVMLMTLTLVGCGKTDNDDDKVVDLYGGNSAEERLVFEKREFEGSADLTVFWFDEALRDDIKVAEELYKELYGGKISYYYSSWNDRATDLALLNSSQQLPDVILGSATGDFPTFIDMGLFMEIGEDEFDFNNEYVSEEGTNVAKWNGKTYGISEIEDPEVIIYNKKYITQLGYETPWKMYQKGTWNWESFRKLAKDLSYDSDKDGTIDHYGFNTWSMNGLFVSNGVWPLAGTNEKPQSNVDSQAIKEAYQLIYDMNNVDKSFSPKEGMNAFSAGELAMYLERPLYISQLIKNGIPAEDIEIAPVPKGPSASENIAFSKAIVHSLGNSCKNKEAALAFIECYISVHAEMTKTGPRESYGYSWSEQQKACMDEVKKFTKMKLTPTAYGTFNNNLTSVMNEILNGSTVSTAIEMYKNKMESSLPK